MQYKKVLLLSTTAILGAFWLYKHQKNQVSKITANEIEELTGKIEHVQTAIQKIKTQTQQLTNQLNNEKFSEQIANSLTDYQFQIEPILNRIQKLSKKIQ